MELGISLYRCNGSERCETPNCPHFNIHPKVIHPYRCDISRICDCDGDTKCYAQKDLMSFQPLLDSRDLQLSDALTVAQNLWAYWDGNALVAKYPHRQEEIQEAFEELIRILKR